MLGKKKKVDPEIEKAIRNLREKYHALETERNFGRISEEDYIRQIKPIIDGVEDLEIAKDELDADEFDKAVHRFIEEIFKGEE